ncbi:DUF3103 family protein [Streptomyces sp. HPF1205]|uniref:DUF3103 family protein n=1 Tax=Streptomyces sp. HPF1205 TaxID=2873262 RepID=UPI001CED9DD8|nr:DUF3103 family protein [Streptomyces sp. HPF1205]
MNRSITWRGALSLVACAATVAALQGLASPSAVARPEAAPAAAAPASSAASASSTVSRAEARTARSLAASLADPVWRAQVRSAALSGHDVDLSALTAASTTPAGRALEAQVSAADQRIAAAKGLGKDVGSLLRLRLGTQAMAAGLRPGTVPLVAAAVTGGKASTATAYDAQGRTHTLDARTAPKQAVYVIDIDGTKAAAAGMSVINRTLQAAGLDAGTSAAPKSAATDRAAAATSGYWATKLDAVYLTDDEEPWIEGDAEIYSLVSGFGWDGKVRVDSVDMPYLDNDHHTYYPNQLVINWSNYKYDAADLVMMESDSGQNYQSLAIAIADALLYITDNGAYQPLVDAILNAIPSAWYTNDDDYVDSWYTITEQESGTIHGARGNGWMTIEPYWVAGL